MKKVTAVAVYMGSACGESATFMDFARDFGKTLAIEGIPAVFGGANVGTMGAFAHGVLDNGGSVTGVFPKGFKGKREVMAMNIKIEFKGLSEIKYVKNFAERKQTMEDLSCCCIALPGSFGTLDELFCYAVDNEIGLHDKPCYVMNLNGYYDGLKAQLEQMRKSGFMPSGCSIIRFVSSTEEFLVEYGKLIEN